MEPSTYLAVMASTIRQLRHEHATMNADLPKAVKILTKANMR